MSKKNVSIEKVNINNLLNTLDDKMNQNIFLIGFMGSGKSHWGRIWASKNGYTFYDLDAQIEKAFKMTVEEIFEKEGEEKVPGIGKVLFAQV